MAWYLYGVDDQVCAGTLTDYAEARRHEYYGDADVSGPWLVTMGPAGIPRLAAAGVTCEVSESDDWFTVVLQCGEDRAVYRVDLRA